MPPIHAIRAVKDRGVSVYQGRASGPRRVWELLDDAWVNDNFNRDFLVQLRNNGGTKQKVAVGSSASAGDHQGDKDYCVSIAAARALRSCGYPEVADFVESHAAEVLACKTNQVQHIGVLLNSRGGWQKTKHIPNFDPLADTSMHATIVQLSDSNGSNTHAIGIAGRWLFDSNQKEALPLTAKSLNACCLGDATFDHASYAVRLFPGKRLKKRKRETTV